MCNKICLIIRLSNLNKDWYGYFILYVLSLQHNICYLHDNCVCSDYKFYSPRHKYRRVASNPVSNIPGLPTFPGTDTSPTMASAQGFRTVNECMARYFPLPHISQEEDYNPVIPNIFNICCGALIHKISRLPHPNIICNHYHSFTLFIRTIINPFTKLSIQHTFLTVINVGHHHIYLKFLMATSHQPSRNIWLAYNPSLEVMSVDACMYWNVKALLTIYFFLPGSNVLLTLLCFNLTDISFQPTSPAKFCDECGAPYLRETSKFCSECGGKRFGT
ncbi:Uncharacterized protein CK203_104282 [Vitis vinifera]|uniref:Zinc-ribbon domain-containing protein n=1 Tax=Vitis vinifera TaxID=29760 RepID=A0A438EJG5_VITVI|nr:Uncharacterized protein CK203_104282 [Vitis vinifera]